MLLCCHLQYDSGLINNADAISLPARREKASKISSPQGKSASLAAGLLLRYGLFLHGLADPQVLTDGKGRPYIEGNPVFFSLSHSGDYAVCAFSRHAVGVDIQKIVSVSERVIRRYSTGAELAWLADQADPGQAAIALWALKESYLKASGALTEEVFRTGFVVLETGEIVGPAGWTFTLYDSIEGYCLALCEQKSMDGVSASKT